MRQTQRSSSRSNAATQQKEALTKIKKRRAAAVKGGRKGPSSKEIALNENDHVEKRNVEADLKAILQYRTSPRHSWKEVTRALNASKSGASFLLNRPCEVGSLVTVVISMPPEFRVYDFDEEFYPVIGLIQYCNETFAPKGKTMYSVGVAFVGKDFPAGYDIDPTRNYHISGTASTGMWQIKPSLGQFKVRAATRFWTELDVTIAMIQRKRTPDYKQETVTCNVSTSGALVVCSLDVAIGQKVKFASKEKDFYSICVVRDRQFRDGQLPLLHLEFVDNKFPVEKIPAPKVTAVTT